MLQCKFTPETTCRSHHGTWRRILLHFCRARPTPEPRSEKFDGEICGEVLVEYASDDFPSKRSSKISFQTSPEVRHQFRRKLRQLHSGNRWCLFLLLLFSETPRCPYNRFVHKIAFPPPPPAGKSINLRIFHRFVQFFLILGPFRGGGGVKPDFADKNFMDTQTFLIFPQSGIKMTGASKTSLLNFVVFARFLALTAKVWQVSNHRNSQELTMNQSKTTGLSKLGI